VAPSPYTRFLGSLGLTPLRLSSQMQFDWFTLVCRAYANALHCDAPFSQIYPYLGEGELDFHLTRGSLDQPDPPSQTGSRSSQPFFHNTKGQIDRQTDRPKSIGKNVCWGWWAIPTRPCIRLCISLTAPTLAILAIWLANQNLNKSRKCYRATFFVWDGCLSQTKNCCVQPTCRLWSLLSSFVWRHKRQRKCRKWGDLE